MMCMPRVVGNPLILQSLCTLKMRKKVAIYAFITVLGAELQDKADRSAIVSWKVGVPTGYDAFSNMRLVENSAACVAPSITVQNGVCTMEAVVMIPSSIPMRLKTQNEQQLEIEPLHHT